MPVDHVNGVELYWERRGSGPRLLFCNGSGTTLQTVRPLLDLVAARFDLLAWDYRGLGRSVPLTGPYTMADLAADAVGLLEIAGWDICRVLGVSFGGMVAQEFAATHPERVERLALACTSAGGDGGSSYPLHKLPELPPGQRAAAQLKLADSRWDERWLEAHPADRALAEGPPDRGWPGSAVPSRPAASTAQLDARAGHDVWDRLDAISCPAWSARLRRDRSGPEQHRDRIAPPRSRAARLRGRTSVPVPGPGRATGIRGIPPSTACVAEQPAD